MSIAPSELDSVRVVMPVHNARNFIEAAVESVLSDMRADDHLVAVDDASSDGSGDWIRWKAETEPRLRVVTNVGSQGVSAALNRGISLDGCPTFVAVAEHDDVVLPGRFAAQRSALLADPRLAAVSGRGRYVGPSGREFGAVMSGPQTVEECFDMRARCEEMLIPHAAVMYRRDAVVAAGLYDTQFDGAQDLDLMNRLVYDLGMPIVCLPNVQFLYRMHSGATSFDGLFEQRLVTRYVRDRNRAVLSGGAIPSLAVWRDSQHLRRSDVRRWQRHDRGALAFRLAGLAWLERRPVRFAANLSLACVLHPQWVAQKLMRQARR